MSNNYYGVHKSDYQSSLAHFKYIKRVKKNGKWVYYYDKKSLKEDVKDALGYDEREIMDAARKINTKAQLDFNKAEKDLDEHNNGRLQIFNSAGPIDKYSQYYIRKLKTAAAAEKYLKTKQEEFNRTPLGVVTKASESIKKATDFVSKLFKSNKQEKQ